MGKMDFDIVRFGEDAILIQVKANPSEHLLSWLLVKRDKLSKALQVEVIHTYNELLIKNLPNSFIIAETKKKVHNILSQDESSVSVKYKTHRIPVCYEEKLAPDINDYANKINLSIPNIVTIHTAPLYTIYFLGFLPGFPYLEGLDPKLHLARKASPSRKIPAGGVGIGGGQTGIYPQESPGGWHVIGQTPLSLFDIRKKNPLLFNAGDTIKFYPISIEEFGELQQSYKR